MKRGSIRVWDLPVRVFHWLLAASFVLAWLLRGDQYLHLHVLAGYVFCFLLLFRLYWGMAGSFHARFGHFVHPLPEVWSYLKRVVKGEAPRFLGHNPAGGWAVLILLSLGLMISVSGVLTLGMEEGHGPLAGMWNPSWGVVFHEIHEMVAWLMLFVVFLHLGGVLWESFLHRENLALAMVTGRKYPAKMEERHDVPRHGWVALGLGLTILGFSLWWSRGYLLTPSEQFYLPFSGPDLARNSMWEEECGACHLAYHPSLLPVRSWTELLARQHDHFSEDLYLDEESLQALTSFARQNASENHITEVSWKIDSSIPEEQVPVRITATPYWKDKHMDIPEMLWKKPEIGGRHACGSCHKDAQQGWFEDSSMTIPIRMNEI